MRRRLAFTLLLLPLPAVAQPLPATPLPALPPLPAVPLVRGVTMPADGTWRVEFHAGAETLEVAQRTMLGQLGRVLEAGSIGRVTLIAEVSEGDDLSTTRRLSLVRARAVKAALVAGGLSEIRVDIRAMGRTEAGRDAVDVLAPTAAKP